MSSHTARRGANQHVGRARQSEDPLGDKKNICTSQEHLVEVVEGEKRIYVRRTGLPRALSELRLLSKERVRAPGRESTCADLLIATAAKHVQPFGIRDDGEEDSRDGGGSRCARWSKLLPGQRLQIELVQIVAEACALAVTASLRPPPLAYRPSNPLS